LRIKSSDVRARSEEINPSISRVLRRREKPRRALRTKSQVLMVKSQVLIQKSTFDGFFNLWRSMPTKWLSERPQFPKVPTGITIEGPFVNLPRRASASTLRPDSRPRDFANLRFLSQPCLTRAGPIAIVRQEVECLGFDLNSTSWVSNQAHRERGRGTRP